ncbi:HPr family phosphocarrier protein [Superficieibacter sp.]|uniref:HPr family phosphocarrier protein n=1 Tax=Superficieibacter sp. TaxID=2303322 RepID=UPI0028ABEB4F|nr:HPr family phosphocarrier protein [Superficieibacter sp.]
MVNNHCHAQFIIRNENGLHARPGAHFVATLKPFSCAVKVANLSRDEKRVNAKSLMALLSLGIKKGHEIRVEFEGEDAESAMQSLASEIEKGLGE